MEEVKITPEESAMLLHGREYKPGEEGELTDAGTRITIPMSEAALSSIKEGRRLAAEHEAARAAENVSKSDTDDSGENYAWKEMQKKADMKEGLRKLIMSAIKNATEGKIRNDAATIETLKALPEAIRVYLSLSETLPDWSIEAMCSQKGNNIIVTSQEDYDRLSQKLNEKIEEQKKALSGW